MTGFGGALVIAPALFATLEPPQAVVTVVLIGLVQSGVMAVHGRADVLRAELGPLLAAAVPGLFVGAFVLRVASASALRVSVGVAVLGAVAAQAALRGLSVSRRVAPSVGFLTGALTTSVTINGPPMVLYLRGRGASPAETRATLGAAFVGLAVLALVPLAVTDTLQLPPLTSLAALGVALPLGLAGGIWIAPRIPDAIHARASTLLLVALGVASIVGGLR
ncbi:MAG: hypothetical protein AVDCRST_MAG79-2126 [uncultured Thermoleophilia bacterium]|uniref:Probable membrane transporter protein n=1 Tax=uncultured Thermoleophilia bacterium TaxID=1497501 RepID=A0A6J4U8Q0_9ACTN|nr:MAG: hypothetical protein AVDCRST_MAG79-2126 [uncultured Thermoleophilia bacterium]